MSEGDNVLTSKSEIARLRKAAEPKIAGEELRQKILKSKSVDEVIALLKEAGVPLRRRSPFHS